MQRLKENQYRFLTFAEVLDFLEKFTDQLDRSKQQVNLSVWKKDYGIVGGVSFTNLCAKIKPTFGIALIPEECIQYPRGGGYVLTFEEGYVSEQEQKKAEKSTTESPEEKEDLESKTKAELLALAKEKDLDVNTSMKKEEILAALLAS